MVLRVSYLLSLWFCLLALAGMGQTYSIAWDKTFGTANFDDQVFGVSLTPDTNILVTGYYKDKMCVYKIDTAGNKLWERYYQGIGGGSRGIKIAESIEKDGYLIAGSISNARPGNDLTQTLRGESDIWILKIDYNGNKIWDKRYGGSSHEYVSDIIARSDAYLVIGVTASPKDGDIVVEPKYAQQPNYDLWAILIDRNGNLIRQARWGGSGNESSTTTIAYMSSSKHYYILSSTDSPQDGDLSEARLGQRDFWLIVADTMLNVVSEKRFGGSSSQYANTIFNNKDSLFLVGSSSSFISGNKSTDNIGQTGMSDGWIITLDTLGRKIRDISLGGEREDQIYQIRNSKFNKLVLVGDSDSDRGFDKSEDSKGSRDFWITLTNSVLNKVWDMTIGGTDVEFCCFSTVLPDGSIILAGNSQSGIGGDKTSDRIGPPGQYDTWIVKLKPDQPLALERFTLTVQQNFDRVRLNWQSTGKPTDRYFIQRTDTLSRPFTAIGERQGSTSFTDTHPLTGYNYYRIQAVSESGDTSYSNIASVRHSVTSKAGLQIATVGDDIAINYKFSGELPAEMTVFDLNGQAIWQATVWHNDGQFTFPKRDLSTGVYSCRLSANHIFFHQQKFIITE